MTRTESHWRERLDRRKVERLKVTGEKDWRRGKIRRRTESQRRERRKI